MELSVKSIVNRVNSSNAISLSQALLSDAKARGRFSLKQYELEVLHSIQTTPDIHPVNLIGMTGLFFLLKEHFDAPSFGLSDKMSMLRNKSGNMFVCFLFMFELIEESQMSWYIESLFQNVHQKPELVEALSSLLAICYQKFSASHPSLLSLLYSLYLQVDNDGTPKSLRLKFLMMDLKDMFDNKSGKAHAYSKDIDFLKKNKPFVDSNCGKKKVSAFSKFFNTNLRNELFTCISKSVNVVDCYKRILDHDFTNAQYVEVFLCLAYCASREKPYNPFYGQVARSLVLKGPRKYRRILVESLSRFNQIFGKESEKLKSFKSDVQSRI
jgi:hypothetical protein